MNVKLTTLAFGAALLATLSSCATRKTHSETLFLYPPTPKARPTPKPTPTPVVRVLAKPLPKLKLGPKPAPKPMLKPVPNKKAAAPTPAAAKQSTPRPVIKLQPFSPAENEPATAPGRKPKLSPSPNPARKSPATPSVKPAPPAATTGPTSVAHVGDFIIKYREGMIAKVVVKKKTGDRALDRKSVEWIWAKFRVRQGATGESLITLTWHDNQDRPTPHFY